MSVNIFGAGSNVQLLKGPPGVGFQLDEEGNYDMQNKRIVNLAGSIDSSDAITKEEVENNTNNIFDTLVVVNSTTSKHEENIETLNDKLNTNQDELLELKNTIDSSKIEFVELNNKVDNFNNEFVELKNTVDNFNNELLELNNEIKNFNNDFAELNDKVNSSNTEHVEFKNKVETSNIVFESDIEQIKETMTTLNNKHDSLNEQYLNLVKVAEEHLNQIVNSENAIEQFVNEFRGKLTTFEEIVDTQILNLSNNYNSLNQKTQDIENRNFVDDAKLKTVTDEWNRINNQRNETARRNLLADLIPKFDKITEDISALNELKNDVENIKQVTDKQNVVDIINETVNPTFERINHELRLVQNSTNNIFQLNRNMEALKTRVARIDNRIQ